MNEAVLPLSENGKVNWTHVISLNESTALLSLSIIVLNVRVIGPAIALEGVNADPQITR